MYSSVMDGSGSGCYGLLIANVVISAARTTTAGVVIKVTFSAVYSRSFLLLLCS